MSDDIEAIRIHWKAQNEAITRVRELHKQIDGIGVKVCAVCIDDNMYWTEQTNYPCPTIQALGYEQ